MRSLKLFLLLSLLVASAAIALPTTPSEEESFMDDNDDAAEENSDIPLQENQETTSSLRGTKRYLAQETRGVQMTCDKYPRVCRAKGSPGPDCCKKKCVNVKTDKLNCGKCGKKCKYPEICCKGVCVNPMSNKKHCGGCNNKCKQGSQCVYGMCSYA
ncbi:stigma-specific STIG1-like protein 1 [Manihot esculenta]|uniref:Stigma-specific STIG1-like protein 1 n=1 Tax=Manihot esculenta TaxID=3983 RepID=A0A2C9U7L6_MANES|nr:stigma-specific STIG1-like protein 1 [Manihot esculenta]OAY25889.1 hypothetical protein MANES_16G003700v8 [Manihot esculenta]